jgi:hypothetical protein
VVGKGSDRGTTDKALASPYEGFRYKTTEEMYDSRSLYEPWGGFFGIRPIISETRKRHERRAVRGVD